MIFQFLQNFLNSKQKNLLKAFFKDERMIKFLYILKISKLKIIYDIN